MQGAEWTRNLSRPAGCQTGVASLERRDPRHFRLISA